MADVAETLSVMDNDAGVKGLPGRQGANQPAYCPGCVTLATLR